MKNRDLPSHHWKGPLLILGAAGLWSLAGLGIKSLPLPPLATAGLRSAFALPVIAIFLRRQISFSMLKYPNTAGSALAYGAAVCLFVAANRMTTAANAILLQYCAPAWICVLSYPMIGEKPRRRDLMVAAFCLAGLILFFLETLTPEGRLGMIFALISGLAMALLFLGLRREGRRAEGSAAGTVILAGNLICLAAGVPSIASCLADIGPREWIILASLGTVQLGLAYVLFALGLRHVPALRASLLGLIEPILNPLWVALATGELPGRGTLAGGMIVIGTLALDALLKKSLAAQAARRKA